MGNDGGYQAFPNRTSSANSAALLSPLTLAVSNASGLILAWNMHVTSVLWWDGMELFATFYLSKRPRIACGVEEEIDEDSCGLQDVL